MTDRQGTKPTDFAVWVTTNPPPSLQALIDAHGGDYWAIPEEAWRAQLAATKDWEARRRDRFYR